MATRYDPAQLKELMLQMVETELGGEQVYRTALKCAINEDLSKEWEDYLEQTLHHQEVITGACQALGIDPSRRGETLEVADYVRIANHCAARG